MKLYTLLLSILLLVAASAVAQFKVTPDHVEIAERGSVDSLSILTGTNLFSVIQPLNWRLSVAANEQTITLNGPDSSSVILIRFTRPNDLLVPLVKKDELEKVVASRFPGGRVTGKFSAMTGYRPGEGFEVSWRRDTNSVFSSRFALVPYPGGTAEFTLMSTADGMVTNIFPYAMLLNSFSKLDLPASR